MDFPEFSSWLGTLKLSWGVSLVHDDTGMRSIAPSEMRWLWSWQGCSSMAAYQPRHTLSRKEWGWKQLQDHDFLYICCLSCCTTRTSESLRISYCFCRQNSFSPEFAHKAIARPPMQQKAHLALLEGKCWGALNRSRRQSITTLHRKKKSHHNQQTQQLHTCVDMKLRKVESP